MLGRERTRDRGGGVLCDVALGAHAGNDGGDGRRREAETQRRARQRLAFAHAQIRLHALDSFPHFALAVAGKVFVSPVALGEFRLRCDRAREAPFIERHAGDDADVEFPADGEEFVLWCAKFGIIINY